MSKQSKKIKRKLLRDPIFRFIFAVQVGGDQESFSDYFQKTWDMKINDDGKFAGLFAWNPDYKTSCGIWVSKFESPLIAHEIMHAVSHVVTVLRIDISNNNEFASFYHEWLTREIVDLGYKHK